MSEKIITTDVEGKDGIINISGSCLIKGSVLNADVRVTEDLKIEGTVIGSKVLSSGGNISISQGIEGKECEVNAFGDIRASYISGGSVKSVNGSIYIKNRVLNSSIFARNLVHVNTGAGIISKSRVEAGIEILANSLGSIEKDETIVVLNNLRQQEMFELVLIYEQKLKEKLRKLQKLSKVIKIIQLLGERIVSLPASKKAELALQVKEFKELKSEIAQTNAEKEKVIKRNRELKMYTRAIIVNDTVNPNVEVIIDKLKHKVTRTFKKVIFYKTGIIIMGDLDQFKLRQR
jgi:uncharacterized protein (DUF342 family)